MTDKLGQYFEEVEALTVEKNPEFGPENPARILPLISGTGDRQLLVEWIEQHAEYEAAQVDPDSNSITSASFDLCIFDNAGLHTHLDELRERKEAAAPVHLPYLLVYPDQDRSIIDADRGELADSVLRETVDEIVSLPLKKSELEWRVTALLRLRSQSLQLKADKRQLRRFKQAADAAGLAIYITDSAGTIEYVNPAFERITGYEPAEAIGENPRILKSGEMSDEYYDKLWETVSRGEMWVEEVINRRKNGELYDAEQTIAPITGPEGDVVGYVAIQQDITERKQEYQKLQEYRQAVESSSDLLAAVDTDLNYLFANEKYCEYHGLELQSIQGKKLPEVLGEDSFTKVQEGVNDALEGDSTELEISRETPHLGERTLYTHLFPILKESGEIRGVGASMRDITERKRLEEDLRETKNRYKSLFDSIQDPILVADTNRRIINCNPAFTELFGYELEEIEGKHTKYVYASEEEYDELGDAIAGHMSDPEFSHTVDYERKSGQTFPGQTNVFYLRDDADEIVGFIGVIKDISDRQDRIGQLQRVDHILRHNFHNALNVIQGYADTIEAEAAQPVTGYAGRIKETSNSLLATVDKEREITEFLSDPPSTKTIEISKRCKNIVESVSLDFPQAEISTSYDAAATITATEAIDLAIEELLTNSIIHADREAPRVSLKVSTSSEAVAIEVIDENPRIPEMERKVLTEEEEISPLFHGSGMGLWLVHLIVSQAGGKLEFDENNPEGNVVTIQFPCGNGD
jgi:PAS domain S-box-containing protein